jgi:hypothetical protein
MTQTKEIVLRNAIKTQNIILIQKLMRIYTFDATTLNQAFLLSVKTLNLKIIDFLINFTDDPSFYKDLGFKSLSNQPLTNEILDTINYLIC